ncbi:serine/threonine protein kinase [Chamaesiphon sp.]|uniref:serine/threonine protein kinase n=1 Tax=Chamaesiphon sp. TaxID=2814140 RepID=UPI003592F692
MNINTVLIDRYQIRQQLSQKAGRRTFLAHDLQSQDLVIIKILRFDPDFQWDDLKLFEREASTLQNLDHPAIPKYLDYFEIEEPGTRGFALVQTYINAPSLESIVKEGRKFSEVEVIALADRILSILTYLHHQHPPVIHRDIKPSNILLTNRSGHSIGDVYLVDFGSVQTVASKDGGTITIVGSYGYIPLEQFGGHTTTASDLYSLGMTVIYLLTGTHPAELAQVNGRVKFTAEISNKFHRWLEKMTQPHLEKRFESAKLAQVALASKDGSYGDFIHLKPADSKVKLDRDRDRLQLKFKTLFASKTIETIDFLCSSVLPCMMMLGVFAWFLYLVCPLIIIGLVAALLVSPLHILLLFMYWVSIRPLLIVAQRININLFQKYTIVTIADNQLSEFKYAGNLDRYQQLHQASKRSAIESIVYNPGYTFDKYLDANGKSVSRGEVKVQPELSLLLKSERYIIGRGLSQAELWWLSQELSDFLNLELHIIYPTPQVPPEPSCGGC